MGKIVTPLLMVTYAILSGCVAALVWRGGSDGGTAMAAFIGTLGVCVAFHAYATQKMAEIRITKDLLTGEIREEVPAKIGALGLKFGAVPTHADTVYVTRTSPQIQVAMSLDKFLELAGVKP